MSQSCHFLISESVRSVFSVIERKQKLIANTEINTLLNNLFLINCNEILNTKNQTRRAVNGTT